VCERVISEFVVALWGICVYTVDGERVCACCELVALFCARPRPIDGPRLAWEQIAIIPLPHRYRPRASRSRGRSWRSSHALSHPPASSSTRSSPLPVVHPYTGSKVADELLTGHLITHLSGDLITHLIIISA
jgi:hypothetical protein